MTKRFGFTLAEVLITLGIIGVVAAMTMPTLINQTNDAQYKAAYKKGMSTISQAVTLNQALDDENFETVDLAASDAVADDAIATILKRRMNIASSGKCKTDMDTNGLKCQTDMTDYIATTDGIMLQYEKAAQCTDADKNTSGNIEAQGTACKGYLDVNGAKGPDAVIGSKEQYTDLYPVFIQSSSVVPASEAARLALYDADAKDISKASKDFIKKATE